MTASTYQLSRLRRGKQLSQRRSELRGRGVVRVKQHALSAGLLYCKNCEKPMIATYTAKRGRRPRSGNRRVANRQVPLYCQNALRLQSPTIVKFKIVFES